jgi:hypothetical protein
MKVDTRDLYAVGRILGTSVGDPRYDPSADFNNDGFVDLFDLSCATLNFGRSYPGDARQPVEITHEVQDGYVAVYGSVAWKWLDYP